MSDRERPLSALPSPLARAMAVAAIVVAGVCGALIGWGFVKVQCTGDCTTPMGIGAVVGGVVAAAGVAVVAVLTLRAMGEWKTIKEQGLNDSGDGTAPAGLGSPPAPR